MAYEVFKKTATRVDAPAISIASDGRIILNSAATRLFSEARVTAALLLWDKAASKIAIKGASKKDGNSFSISTHPSRHSATMRAKSFLDYIGWTGTKREMLPATWDASQKMLEVAVPLVGRFVSGLETMTMDEKEKRDLEDVMRTEKSRGRRPVDMDARRARAKLLRALRTQLAKSEAEFIEAMRDAGLEDDSPEMLIALRAWREFRP